MKGIVLTRSAMDSHNAKGVCTTVYDFENARIIRVVSNEQGGPIPDPYNKRYSCLDIIEFESIKTCPVGPQQENILVDLDSITRIGKYTGSFDGIYNSCCMAIINEPLFMDQQKNKMDSVDIYKHSLEIKKVHNLTIELSDWKTTKAQFIAPSEKYKEGYFNYFSVKDPNYMLEWHPNVKREIGDAYIVVSIPNSPHVFNGEIKGYYKIIAAIYPVD